MFKLCLSLKNMTNTIIYSCDLQIYAKSDRIALDI